MSDRTARQEIGRRATFLLLTLFLAAVVLAEWRNKVVLDRQLEHREALIQQRRQVLALEREVLLARSEEAEIVSAGRSSLVAPLRERWAGLESQIEGPAPELAAVGEEFATLGLALGKYRQSVESELGLLAKLGLLGESGQLAKLRDLEGRILTSVPVSLQAELLQLQLLEREFAATLQTSKALRLLEQVDALRSRGGVSSTARILLDDYRKLVESAMSDALALELLRSESSLRFTRLPAMFRDLESVVDQRLDAHLLTMTRQRRDADRLTMALLLGALLTLTVRFRQQRRENLRLQGRISRLADAMETFAAGGEEIDLDLPRSGRLGAVTEAFISMAGRIRYQIETIRAERNRVEKALRVKSDFLARVSHELRTPLHGILGMAEILLQSSRDERQEHLVRSISHSGSTLLSVVNDLLDYSKLEAGKLVLVNQSFDLIELCETQLAIHATAAHSKGLELHLRTDQRTASVLGDPLRLGQILTNLLGNAIKFTDRGFVDLAVRRVDDPVDGDPVDGDGSTDEPLFEIRVRDTGPGIPQAMRSEIFESFAQAAPVTRRREGGSGLGLSIVQELLSLMQGKIRIEDPPVDDDQGGIVFVVEMRLSQSESESVATDPLAESRLLLVDADPGYASSLIERLRQMGCSVKHRRAVDEVDRQDLRDAQVVLVGLTARGGDAEWQLSRSWLENLDVPAILLVPAGGWSRQEASEIPELPRVCRRREIETAVAEQLGLAVSAKAISPEVELQNLKLSGRILLVEDNPINRDVVQLMLEDCGCQVETVVNGRLAVEKMRSHTFDLILMDCHMPEMDGYEATRQIRKNESHNSASMPILALTASVLEEDRRRCREAGMDDVLGKPISQQELKQALHHWLTR